jgi:hypothetical protein
VNSSKIDGQLIVDEDKDIIISLEIEGLSSTLSVCEGSSENTSESKIVSIILIISESHVIKRKPSLVIELIT